MLVLTRKLGETIQIGDDVTLTVIRVKGNTVRLGIEAPSSVRVRRGELPPRVERGEIEMVISDDGESSPGTWVVERDGGVRPEERGAVGEVPSPRVLREARTLREIVDRVAHLPLKTIARSNMN